MLEPNLGALWMTLEELRTLGRKAKEIGAEYMDHSLLANAGPFLNTLERECARLEIDANARFAFLRRALDSNVTGTDLAAGVRDVLLRVSDALGTKIVYYFNDGGDKHLRGMDVMWEEAFSKFPSARKEVEDAVWCYAFERYTASIFHLMRAVEHGIRALAKERSVTFASKAIEYAPWGTLLQKIETQCLQVENWPASAARIAAKDFYSGVRGEMHALKDMYRDNVSHVRHEYERADADVAMTYVRSMLKRLGSKISETTAIPLQESDWS